LSWAKQHAKSDQPIAPAELDRGLRLARERKVLMSGLIESDPQRAIDLALPQYLAHALPPAVAEQVENHINARGDLMVAIADSLKPSVAPQTLRNTVIGGKNYRAFVYGKRLQQSSKLDIPMHGIALGDAMAVHESPVQILKPDEIAALDPQTAFANVKGQCPMTGKGVSARNVVQSGGSYYQMCCEVCGSDLSNQLSSQLNGPDPNSGSLAGTVAPSSWTTGQKTVLVILADFTDAGNSTAPSTLTSLIDTSVSNFYVADSYGLTSMKSTVTALLHLPNNTSYYTTNYANAMSDGYTAASNAGYNPGSYDRYVVATPHINGGIAGVGYVGGAGVALFGYFDLGAPAHELGHNYGCWHSNYWSCTDGTVIGAGSNQEYGNPFSIMTFDDGQASNARNHDAYMKNQFGWLPSANVTTVSASGSYTIHAFDDPTFNSGNKYALTIHDAAKSNNYWVELRQQFTSNPYLMNGADLIWSPWASSNNGTDLLDTTPGTSPGLQDSAIVVGRTFADTTNGIYITPTAKNGTTTGNQTLTVQVNIGTFSTNPPTVAVSSNPTATTVNSAVTLTATGSDPSGYSLAYYWTFGDGTFSTDNNAVESKSWGATGTYTVTCFITNMKGGTASATTNVTVGTSSAPTITTQPSDQTVVAGQTATFNVAATGTGTISYQWQLNNLDIAQNSTGSSYTTPVTALSDSGSKFRCIVSNSSGSSTSNSVTLTVNPAPVPPAITTQPSDKTVTEGQTATFTVAASGTPSPTYKWQKNDNDIPGASGSTYTTPPTTAADNNAQFKCIATNSGGSATSNAATLTVNLIPALTSAAFALPNPALVSQSVVFTAAASDADGDTLTYAWNFGDGVTDSGASVAHAYAVSGTYTATVTISDPAGATVTSSVLVNVFVNSFGDTIWVEDKIPAGGNPASDGGDSWNWIGANPAPYSGTLASQSNIATGEHQHYFTGATQRLTVDTGDVLIAEVYLDPANTPSEIMLQWNNGSWEHRAYWGANKLGWGSNGTISRFNAGALPPAGQWVRLQIPASQVGLEGSTLTGMAFTLYDGRATWDYAGKSSGGIMVAPTFTSTLSASGTVGTAFSYTITASTFVSSYDAIGLPAGLSIDTATGIISGTPTAAGTSTVTLSVANGVGSGTAALILTISDADTGTGGGTDTGTGTGTDTGTGTGTGTGGGGAGSGNVIAFKLKAMHGAMTKSGGHDGCSLSGTIPGLPAQFSPLGATVQLDVGGASNSFTLDKRGHASNAHGSFALSLKLTTNKTTHKHFFAGGDAKFTARLTAGSWAGVWSAAGMNVNATSANIPATVTTTLTLNGQMYQIPASVLYSAKSGKGAFKKK
jgi:hypothetical protein